MINDFNDLLEYLYVNDLVDKNLNLKEEEQEKEEESKKVLIKEKYNKNISKPKR